MGVSPSSAVLTLGILASHLLLMCTLMVMWERIHIEARKWLTLGFLSVWCPSCGNEEVVKTIECWYRAGDD
ncbi:hypothetical protein CPB85DRAFT_974633 [Mucidula mucida]|nr:hypothetical protein CPB85DRAFT_974633 [Mucidula mucida]